MATEYIAKPHPLVKKVIEQDKHITELEAIVAELTARIEALEANAQETEV